jgi:hypothetical protein
MGTKTFMPIKGQVEAKEFAIMVHLGFKGWRGVFLGVWRVRRKTSNRCRN